MNDELYPSDKYKKQEFTFTKQELYLINTYHTIKAIGELAGLLINNFMKSTVLPRIGVTPNSSIKSIYDNVNGTFTVYTELHPEKESTGGTDGNK